jgi:hypothetical protein
MIFLQIQSDLDKQDSLERINPISGRLHVRSYSFHRQNVPCLEESSCERKALHIILSAEFSLPLTEVRLYTKASFILQDCKLWGMLPTIITLIYWKIIRYFTSVNVLLSAVWPDGQHYCQLTVVVEFDGSCLPSIHWLLSVYAAFTVLFVLFNSIRRYEFTILRWNIWQRWLDLHFTKVGSW